MSNTPRTDIDPDDWDQHWGSFGVLAETNPANIYRRELVLRLLGQVRPGATLLDIGSGQGDITIDIKKAYPELKVWGVEYSAVGIERARPSLSTVGSMSTSCSET